MCGRLRSTVILHMYDGCLLLQKSFAVHRQLPLCSSLSCYALIHRGQDAPYILSAQSCPTLLPKVHYVAILHEILRNSNNQLLVLGPFTRNSPHVIPYPYSTSSASSPTVSGKGSDIYTVVLDLCRIMHLILL